MSSKALTVKSKKVLELIAEAEDILVSVGIPLHKETLRRRQRIAMAFLAVSGVSENWKTAKSLKDGRKIKTREIIAYINAHFGETLSPGSYDDIRRKDLSMLVLGDLVINSGDNPSAATNDPTRGYSLENDFKELIQTYKTKNWLDHLTKFIRLKGSLAEKLNRPRALKRMDVLLSTGELLQLAENYHNSLQKVIIEEFLPRYGYGCEVLYVGDAADRVLIYAKDKLHVLGFFELGSEELPDVIAYSPEKNWLFLIEAVTSSGPMSDKRVLEIKKLTKNCQADLIFITAFHNRTDFRKWAQDIAWETEVWIADTPSHMIHFNGDKFLGPYL